LTPLSCGKFSLHTSRECDKLALLIHFSVNKPNSYRLNNPHLNLFGGALFFNFYAKWKRKGVASEGEPINTQVQERIDVKRGVQKESSVRGIEYDVHAQGLTYLTVSS